MNEIRSTCHELADLARRSSHVAPQVGNVDFIQDCEDRFVALGGSAPGDPAGGTPPDLCIEVAKGVEKRIIKTVSESADQLATDPKLMNEWRKSFATVVAIRRRLSLESPHDPQTLSGDLYWLSERAMPGDISLVEALERNPPFGGNDVMPRLATVRSRIEARVQKLRDPRPITEAQAKAWESFCKDLRRLMDDPEARDRWVAYHGSRRVAIVDSKQEAYARLREEGCARNEILVRRVRPLPGPIDMRSGRGARIQ